MNCKAIITTAVLSLAMPGMTAAALAAQPVKGATYSATWKSGSYKGKVAFKVSANGKAGLPKFVGIFGPFSG